MNILYLIDLKISIPTIVTIIQALNIPNMLMKNEQIKNITIILNIKTKYDRPNIDCTLLFFLNLNIPKYRLNCTGRLKLYQNI